MSLIASISFIVCHGGPADHFATFAKNLPVEIYASETALQKFQEQGVAVKYVFSLDIEEDVLRVAEMCSNASAVITDVGHAFDVKVQKTLADLAPHVRRLAYYDNPEPYVPGGYSEVAREVMKAAHEVLFANANLISQFPDQTNIGIGYYPLKKADEIANLRLERKEPQDKKVLVYFGGNNPEYFSEAFPAFLSLLEQAMEKVDFSKVKVILQQHPGAKQTNIDSRALAEWIDKHKNLEMEVSTISSDKAQVIADMALYYQTSMSPQFVLAGIPTIQIGHKTYEDIVVSKKLIPSVTTVDQFVDIMNHPGQADISRDIILQGLGIKTDWLSNLEIALQ